MLKKYTIPGFEKCSQTRYCSTPRNNAKLNKACIYRYTARLHLHFVCSPANLSLSFSLPLLYNRDFSPHYTTRKCSPESPLTLSSPPPFSIHQYTRAHTHSRTRERPRGRCTRLAYIIPAPTLSGNAPLGRATVHVYLFYFTSWTASCMHACTKKRSKRCFRYRLNIIVVGRNSTCFWRKEVFGGRCERRMWSCLVWKGVFVFARGISV